MIKNKIRVSALITCILEALVFTSILEVLTRVIWQEKEIKGS